MGVKRGSDSRVLAKKALKKQKREDDTAHQHQHHQAESIVGLDDLDWQTVQLPDRLGDVGGFFGLEEIDGVEIVRPKASGPIKFKVRAMTGLEKYDLARFYTNKSGLYIGRKRQAYEVDT